MSDKPLFGSNAGSGNNNTNGEAPKSLFGAPSGSAGTGSSTGLFGSKPSTGPSLFGNTSSSNSPFGAVGQNNSAGGGLFGGGAGGGGFGGFGKKSEENTQSTTTQSSNVFGAPSTGSGAATPTATKSGFSFGNAPAASFTPAGPPPSNNLFNLGDTAKNTSTLFGTATSDKPADSSASTPSSNIFGQAAQGSGQTTSLFGTGASKTGGSVFGTPSATPTAPSQGNQAGDAKSVEAPKPNLFQFPASTSASSGTAAKPDASAQSAQAATKPPTFSFPSANNATNSASTPTTEKPSLFGSTPNAAPPASNLFGGAGEKKDAAAGPTTSNNLFANLAGSKDAASTTPAASPFAGFGTKRDAAAPATGTSNMFSGLGQKKDDSSASAAPSLFGTPTEKKDTASAPVNAPLFGATSEKKDAAPAASVFTNFGKKPEGTATSAPTPAQGQGSTAAPASTATAPATTSTATGAPPSLFGSTAVKPAETSTTTPSLFGATASKPAEATTTQAPAASTLGASTAGPAPTPQSRLKNKSVDEIITRWASDLSKYQKEFQMQAEKVAAWDRMLIDNGNAISKLYSKTFQAERDTAEVQKQLSAVESHQDELSQWLDRYEREVDEMLARQVGQGEALQGPDQERERTYKTAERVSERLTDMGKDLTTMIEEINEVSSTISKTSKSDDPLSQIVRVLNGHLSQLQLIDQGAAALQAKVAAAQKESQRLGSRNHGLLASSAADDFYRSYMGGRG